MTALALRMTGADLLKLRKKRSTLIWALVLSMLPIVIFYTVNAIEHASGSTHEPAGGIPSFHDGLRLLGGLFFGPLVAILIGVEAGVGDTSAGVFRDLVVTGRSRLALFASRVPAAVLMCWTVIVSAYALILIGTFVFAGNLETPDAGLILNGLGFLLLASGVLCAVAVGFSSLISSRAGAIIALIAWQIVASPLISSISSLGSGRDFVLSQALAHFAPLQVVNDRAGQLSMSTGVALAIVLLWLAVFLGLGAWRTRTMDA